MRAAPADMTKARPTTAESAIRDPQSESGAPPRTASERNARSVVTRLRRAGYHAYFAGGCVRDRLRGVEPSDYDVATDAPAETVQQLFERTVPVGVQFGVVLVVIDGQPIEVATFRADAEYRDGRHPSSVRFTTAEEDARRRDFTINGMFLDPESGEVIDYVGGRADIAARVIRAIGDPRERFHEDRLRMLRAVRFAAGLGYTIEPATFAAIRALAPEVTGIAWERIGDEIVRILTECPARAGFELLDATGLLEPVLPEVTRLKGVEQSPDYHPEGDVFRHTLLILEQLDRPTETLALGALLHDIAKPLCMNRTDERITFYGHCEQGETMAIAVCQRLRRSSAVWERVGYLVRNHLRHLHAPEMRRSTLRRFLAEDGIDELLDLARIDALASNRDLRCHDFCRAQQAAFANEPLRPPPLVRGRDLLGLGYPPGPLFSEVLKAVEDRQLEGELTSREEALEWVQRQYPRSR
jgi:poly(A) polymerase